MSARILLLGHGGMGRLYASALRDAGALAGVVVGRSETARALSAEIAEPAGTDPEVLVDSTGAQALAVLSPTDWHAPHVRLGLRRQLPTMVIKPACTRPQTARALADEARRAGVPVMVAHEGVFQPAFVALEQAVAEGRIGAVREVQWLVAGKPGLSGGRAMEAPQPADAAGRNFAFLYASVMHDLYAVNRLAGRTAPLRAQVLEVHAARVGARLMASLDYPGGVVARLRYDTNPEAPFKRGLHVVGERGSVLWLIETGRARLEWRSGRTVRDLPFAGFAGFNPATPVVAAFLDVLQGAPVREGLDDGARALEAARLLAASAAAAVGATVDLDAIAGGTDR